MGESWRELAKIGYRNLGGSWVKRRLESSRRRKEIIERQ